MTDPRYTAVALVVDRSGSMQNICKASQDAINDFVNKQASKNGKNTVRLGQFDNLYELVFPSIEAARADTYTLHPRGMTALLDAVGHTIVDFGAELAALPENERPGHVIVGIMTDGLENSSSDFTREQITELVHHHEKIYNWRFLYMGANQDAIVTGAQMGMRANSSLTYNASSAGTHSAANTFNTYVTTTSMGGEPSISDAERKDASR